VAHQQEVAVAVDRGQQVVEVVGDAAGELNVVPPKARQKHK
jgi:hypothetical protein